MRCRGIALPTVLGLVAFLLTIGLAFGTMATLSLHLARKEHLDTRCSLAARSGLAQFLSEVHRLEADRPVELFDAEPLELSGHFSWDPPLVEDCRVSFAPRQGQAHSTDNSHSQYAAAGWLDGRGGGKSVPPYTLELMLNVEVEGTQRTYRALLQRTWPYAAFVRFGHLILAGDPEPGAAGWSFERPTRVEGTVFSSWYHNAPGGLGLQSSARSPRVELILSQIDVPDLGLGGYNSPVVVGPLFSPSAGAPIRPIEDPGFRAAGASRWAIASNRPASPGGTVLQDRGNQLQGDAHIYYSAQLPIAPEVGPGNGYSGKTVLFKEPPRRDPLAEIRLPDPSAYRQVPLERARALFPGSADPLPFLMDRPLRLSSGEGTHYVVRGDLVNRMVWRVDARLAGELRDRGINAEQGALLIEESPGGLELEDCVLVVEGDMDLGADIGGGEVPAVLGSNATLIVTGTLILSGGQLDSKDQGMVVYARDLVLKGGGDFRGLIVAANSITIVPHRNRHLRIRGGLLCGAGAAVLRSVELAWDPRYLRALHGSGSFRLTSWENL